MNPYLSRVMIQEASQFFGRRRELSRIFSRIGVERPQSVSVVGERRIGKSSLLYQLTLPEVQAKLLPGRASHIIVFLDFQQLRNILLRDFFQAVLDRIRRIDPGIAGSDSADYRAFQKVQERLSQGGKQLVLLFDEFDAITSNPVFDRDFYAFLRSVANNAAVAYVTSSKTELQRLCHSSEVADSPFFNIFSTLRLGPFDKEEALHLIAGPSRGAGIPLEPYSTEILALAGLFPFYIQIACSVYFDWLEENPGRDPDHSEVASRFLEEAGPHFEYFWGQCQPESQRVLRSLMSGEQPRQEQADLCRALLREGYIIQEAEGMRLFSSVFSDRIRELERLSGNRESSGQATWRGPREVALDSHVNQYHVLRRVREGGMGVVYQAHDLSLNRKVALKIVKPDLPLMEGARKRFLQEARLAAALAHPAITAVYELLEHQDQVILVMEWLEGETLKEKIVEQGRQEWRRLTHWMIEACSGLEAAHRQGIIHRDIKSSNLMITDDNRLKILDFGLAKHRMMESASPLASDLTVRGALLGTLDYMAPEQACGQPADHRSDLFSLGAVMFEGLTGRLPFRRDHPASTLQAIVNEPAPDLGLHLVEEAELFRPILDRLLAKQPELRFASAADLAKELEKLLRIRKRFLPWRR